MKSRLYKLTILSILLASIVISSCRKKDTNTWAEISGGSGFYLAYNHEYNILGLNDNVNTDTLILGIEIYYNIEYPDEGFFPIFNNSTDYNPKLKHSISNIILRSSYDFNSIQAGDPLNDIVEVLENPYFNGAKWTSTNTLTLQEYAYKYLIQLTNPYNSNNQFLIKFKEKPTQMTQQFELDFIDSQGSHFYIKLDEINWI
jgi:hypothetical protein